jgi:signal transduction histidine kinase
MEKEEYPLDEQIRRTVLLLEPQLQKKRLEVDSHIETVRILANDELLSHLWINILSNAIKFSPDGGTIKITLEQKNDEAVVTISDTGAGMNEEVKKHIFEKFYQGDSSRATEGNGLGLSLVKRILELENGRISVDSELGKGTRFIVSLPI